MDSPSRGGGGGGGEVLLSMARTFYISGIKMGVMHCSVKIKQDLSCCKIDIVYKGVNSFSEVAYKIMFPTYKNGGGGACDISLLSPVC